MLINAEFTMELRPGQRITQVRAFVWLIIEFI